MTGGYMTQPMVRRMTQLADHGFSVAAKNDATMLALQRRGYAERGDRRWHPTALGRAAIAEYEIARALA